MSSDRVGPRSAGAPAPTPAPVRRDLRASVVLFGLLLGYLLAPGHPLSFLTGAPLGLAGLAVTAVLVIAAFGLGAAVPARWARFLAAVVLIAIGLKVTIWALAPTYGLAASYFSRGRLSGAVERSYEHRGVPYTRVEAAPGQPTFGLHFFNDVERFNFYDGDGPDRLRLPFAVRWDGYLQIPIETTYTLALTATGPSVVYLNGRPLLTVPPGPAAQDDQTALDLPAGPHAIRVELIYAGSGPPPELRLDWDDGNGRRLLEPPYLTVDPIDRTRVTRDGVLAWLARGMDVGILLIVLSLVARRAWSLARRARSSVSVAGSLEHGDAQTSIWRRLHPVERPVLALLLLAVLVHALLTTHELYGRSIVLEGGQDWLTYESYARDILLNGPLMTLGKPLGQGRPFFFQPFYPYYLAGLHWLAGEGLWGPIVLQLLGLGVAGVVVYYLAKRLVGVRAAWVVLALYAALWVTQLEWVARKLLSENLYFVVLPASILFLVRFLDRRSWSDLAVAGLLFGVASITRAPTLLYVPIAALIVTVVARREGASLQTAVASFVLLGALTAAVAALVPIRNYVVAGRPALVATNGGATLLLAHTPTPNVRLAGIERNRFYNALNLDRPTREVLEFVRQDPLGYAATLVPLGLYSIGFSGAVEGSTGVSPDILALTALYVAALALLPAARTGRALLLHTFIGLHLLIMMTFLPYVYGYRQVLPMQLLMLVFGGGMLDHLARRWVRRLAVPTSATGVPKAHQSAT